MKRPTVREESVQAAIIQGLEACGYRVFQTTVRGVRRAYGSTPGVPDLLVHHRLWPPAMWCGIEVKGPTTRLSAEQKALHAAGRIIVARSFDEAVAGLQEAECRAFGRVCGLMPVPHKQPRRGE